LSCGGEAVAGLNPVPGHKESPESAPGDEAPSAAAELWVMKVPAGDQPAIPGAWQTRAAGKPSGRIANALRRIGIAAGLRMTVPAGDASEMIAMIRCIIVAFIWGATVVTTLVTSITAGLPAAATVAVVVLELVGFLFAIRRVRRGDGK